MTVPNMAFNPTDGLRNKSSYPTDPLSEDSLRDNVQTGMDQLRDFINTNVVPKMLDKTGDTSTGNQTAPSFSSSGLTGATSASRYVGATTSGAPTTGTFAVGDFVIDRSGLIWICIVAGTPGTWKSAVPVGTVTALSGGTKVHSGFVTGNINPGVTVTFPTAFSSAPSVFATTSNGYLTAYNITATGFTLACSTTVTTNHHWLAIGT